MDDRLLTKSLPIAILKFRPQMRNNSSTYSCINFRILSHFRLKLLAFHNGKILINMSNEILLHPNDHKRKEDWESIFKFLDSYLPYDKIYNSLDLGGGRGDISYHIIQKSPQGKAVCIDVNQKLLDEAARRSNKIKAMNFDINQRLPFKDNSMDLVSSIGTLPYTYIKSMDYTLSEMTRVSKKYIVIDMLYKYRFWPLLISLFHPGTPPKRYSSNQIKEFIQKNNLKVIAKFGTRIPLGNIFPSFGRITIFILEKNA